MGEAILDTGPPASHFRTGYSMRATASVLTFAAFLSSLPIVFAGGGGYSDVCGECRGNLNIPSYSYPESRSDFGGINACLCLSDLPNYLSSSPVAISAVSYGGRDAVTNALSSLIYSGNHGTCNYPPHSKRSCQFGNPCGFTCTDGYTPYPALYPNSCICPFPLTVCNGQCGLYKGCPSGYGRRSLSETSSKLLCSQGLSACQIIGRGADSWECVDTANDLESCGGCMVQSTLPGFSRDEGVDCTAIQGVSDVSCVTGKCRVRRCMPGYSLAKAGDSCVDDGEYYKKNGGSSQLVSQEDSYGK